MNNLFTPVEVNSTIQYDSIPANMRGKAVSLKSMYGNSAKTFIGDAKMHDANFAFLSSSLAKLYTKLVEPKHFVTFQKDIPVDTGGGFVDYVQYYTISFSGIANQVRNVVGNGANYIPRVNAGMTQETAKVYTFELAYDIRFIELEKMKQVQLQKSLESIYQDAIIVAWDFFCQSIAYTGGEDGTSGLFNNTTKVPTNVTAISKAGVIDGSVSDITLAGLINGIIQQSLDESNMNVEVLPDTFLVPTWFGSALTNRFSNLYSNSLRSYLVEHNLLADETGSTKKITIESRPQLNELGSAKAGRIVAYKKDKDFVRIDMPYPMKHYITLPNIERMSYTSAFVGQVSELQMPYTTSKTDLSSPIQYWDFIA